MLIGSALLATAAADRAARLSLGWPNPLPTTSQNFFMRGSQPEPDPQNPQRVPILHSQACFGCHLNGPDTPIGQGWLGSLMAHAARDPVFYACLEIADADAPGVGDVCIRCHAPKAWLEGRSHPTDGSAITAVDRDSISCNFCHRLVDPFSKPGPPGPAPVDAGILAALGENAPNQSMDGLGRPGDSGSANYVIDPEDRRRGPYPLEDGFPPYGPPEAECGNWHPDATYQSGLHTRADLCSTCHDVSLPHFTWNGSAYVFNGAGIPHPTGNKYQMVPNERTYSEWLNSSFAIGDGVDMGERFGGPGQTVVGKCQDCHMPLTTARACAITPPRSDMRDHYLMGASTWVLDAIIDLYGPSSPEPDFYQIEMEAIQANKLRNIEMLEKAADLELSLDDAQTPGIDQLKARVINQTGHKLPSGYPEGRRIWLSVQFFDCTDYETPMWEYGRYDFDTADLTENTKVYEVKAGLDAAMASLTGYPAGETFRFALTNMFFKDNRIPPRGFTNANFAAIGAAPVEYTYADGQFWDDSYFTIPAGWPKLAKVQVYYQATSKEYIEFLRDNNPNPSPNAGTVLHDQWLAQGKGPPVLMVDDTITVELKGDADGNRQVTSDDVPGFVAVLLGADTDARRICVADFNGDESPDGLDIKPFVDQMLAP